MATSAKPGLSENTDKDQLRGQQPRFRTPGESPAVSAARMSGPSMVPNPAGDQVRIAPKAREIR